MTFHRFDNPEQFVERVSPFLMANEAENNLMIGIGHNLARAESMDHSVLLSCVLDGSRVVGAAVMTPPYNLILTRAPEAAIALVASSLRQAGVSIPGVLGPVEPARTFVAHWQRLTGQNVEIAKSMRVFQLTEVVPATGVSGTSRRGTEADLDIAAEWCDAFAVDTHTICTPRDKVLQHIKAGSLWLWTDPEPVAMAVEGTVTPNGRRVSGVYTPPDRRCRGYASALVAELSQSILDSGNRFCFLFTDLANPTSNSIYAKIGYLPVSDYAEYRCGGG